NNPFLGALEFFEWRPPDNFEFAFEVARCNYDRSAARNIATACRYDVGARLFGDKAAVGIDAGAVAAHRPARRKIVGRSPFRYKVHNVAGARGRRTWFDRQVAQRTLHDSDGRR